jgi:hypothetical protein
MRRIALLIIFVFSAALAVGQESAQKPSPQPDPEFDLPRVDVTFSLLKADTPLPLLSTVMDGPPVCSSSGVAFLQFWTPPPTYNNKEVFSITAAGKVAELPVSRVTGLSNAMIRSFDPGSTMAAMLLSAIPQPAAGSGSFGQKHHWDYYLARFKYNGEFNGYTALDLGFEPGQIAQLNDDTYIVIGTDQINSKPVVALINNSGTVLRRLDTDEVVPSEEGLNEMMRATSFVGLKPQDLPPSMKMSVALSRFQFVHFGTKVLLLEPGPHTRIVEISPGGQARVVSVKLPEGQVGDSLLASRSSWMIRTYPEGKDGLSNLYEVDRETGSIVRQLRTPGVPATSIACSSEDGLFGIRWLERKPYLMVADKQ